MYLYDVSTTPSNSVLTPFFQLPTPCTQYDAVLIDKGWIEEYALLELGFEYRLASTGEYELDGRLTFVSTSYLS